MTTEHINGTIFTVKVFIYEDFSEVVDFFGLPPDKIPFLNSTLVDFTKLSMSDQYEAMGEDKPVFYTPAAWGGENPFHGDYSEFLSDDHELVVITTSSNILVGTLTKDDLHFLRERPNQLFHNGAIYAGYINKGVAKTPVEDNSLMTGFHSVNDLNSFLRINQALVSRLSYPYSYDLDGSDVYGDPVILSNSIHNSTICGPSFIGENVHISNSYIGPGSVISGNSSVVNSRIYSSFVYDSSLTNTEQLENSIVGGDSVINGLTGLSNSRLPSGTKLVGPKG